MDVTTCLCVADVRAPVQMTVYQRASWLVGKRVPLLVDMRHDVLNSGSLPKKMCSVLMGPRRCCSFYQTSISVCLQYFNACSHIHLCFSLQWSDHRHRFGCPGQFDFLPGDVFPRCAVPQGPRHPPQESYEEVPGERRGGNFREPCRDPPWLCKVEVLEKKTSFFDRALSLLVPAKKARKFTLAS